MPAQGRHRMATLFRKRLSRLDFFRMFPGPAPTSFEQYKRNELEEDRERRYRRGRKRKR
jgi:hypothetical protein